MWSASSARIPLASFVTETVEDELAYTMENLGVPADAMRRRVEDAIDLLGLQDLRDRSLRALSGGQQQRVAIGAVLTASPRLLVLDEPTSALDPAAAEEVLSALARLVHDLGLTVVMAEHRLERVVPFADRIVLVPGGGAPLVDGAPEVVMRSSPVAPPLVELGRLVGWDPLPLSVRDARRKSAPLRERLAPITPPRRAAPIAPPAERVEAASARKLAVSYGPVAALDGVDLTIMPGEVLALMGRNGSGKSTLLHALSGVRRPTRGAVAVDGRDPRSFRAADLVRHVGLVPQDPGLLLYGESVHAECQTADKASGLAAGTTVRALERLLPGMPPDRHPRDLSEGQRLALALAIVVAPSPALLLLDEPTRGLDYPSKDRLVRVLRDLAGDGHAIVLATHDVELAARVADRAVVLADGQIITDGPARRGGLPLADLRPPGGQGTGPRGVAHGGRSPRGPRRRGAGVTVTVPQRAARARGRLTPAIRFGSRSSFLLLLTTLFGVAAFGWPLLIHQTARPEHRPQR